MSRLSRMVLWALTIMATAATAYAAVRLTQRQRSRPDAAWVQAALTTAEYPALRGAQTGRVLTADGWVAIRAEAYHQGGRWRYDYEAGPCAGHSLVLTARTAAEPALVQAVDHAARAVIPAGAVGGPQPVGALLRNYEAVVLGADQVAGRSAHVIELRSRHRGTVAARFWLDAQTRVPLRTATCNADGRLVAASRFTTIEYGDGPAAGLLGAAPGYRIIPADTTVEHTQSPESLQRELGFAPVTPAPVGDGFARAGTYHYRCRGGNNHAEFRYEDGLRTVSVFEARRRYRSGRGGCDQPGRGLGRGAGGGGRRADQWGFSEQDRAQVVDWGLTRGVRAMQGEFRVVVIGDLPTERLSALAEDTARKLESANAPLVSVDEPAQRGDDA